MLAVTIPALFAYLGAYDASRVRSALDGSALRLVQTAERAYANPEASLCIKVEVPQGNFARAQYIRIGGDSTASDLLRNSTAYRMEGQNEYRFSVDFRLNETGGGALYLYPRSSPYNVCFLRSLDCGGRPCDYVTARVRP